MKRSGLDLCLVMVSSKDIIADWVYPGLERRQWTTDHWWWARLPCISEVGYCQNKENLYFRKILIVHGAFSINYIVLIIA